MSGDDVDIEVLGTLAVWENGASVAPTAAKPRQLLAMLATHADQVVPVSSLIRELWEDAPPRSAQTTLQTYIRQLRALIETALARSGDESRKDPKRVLVTRPGGYLLDTRGGTSDVREFERRAGLGYRATEVGDHLTASRRLREALALWRGPVLADVQCGPLLEMEVRRLEEARLCVLDQRIEAELRLGRHRELLSELTVLVSRYRTHESLHGQFMLALHRSGRRGEALDVYQRLRATLVRELGLEPSAGLRRLQRAILLSGPEPGDGMEETAPDLAVEPLTRAG